MREPAKVSPKNTGARPVRDEDRDLGFVEHLNLLDMRGIARAFIGAQLKDSLARLGRREFWEPGKGRQQGSFYAHKGRADAGAPQKGAAALRNAASSLNRASSVTNASTDVAGMSR